MSVKLISYSQNSAGDSLSDIIAFCARVSNPANQDNKLTAAKLIAYLIKNRHWSPLEMVHVCLEIETTRDIARQILRHRSFAFQEFSQRYADPTKELDFSLREARIQDPGNRQNSIDTHDDFLKNEWAEVQKHVIEEAKEAYQWAIAHGIAKEQARVVLPEGLTKSRMYMSGSLRSWLHYIDVRIKNGTQKEHIEVALQCMFEISKIFPPIGLGMQELNNV